MNKLFDIGESDVVRFMNLFFDVVVPNLGSPRNVIRLAGSLRVTWPAVRGEADPADFMSVETLRLFWPAVYRNVRDHGDLVCGHHASRGHGNAEQRRAKVESALLSGVRGDDHQYVKTALQRMFPHLEGVWGNVHYGSERAEWNLARRVCSRRHFTTYFQYAVSTDSLPSSLRDDLIKRAGDEAFTSEMLLGGLELKRRNGGTRAALLLEELTLLSEQIPKANVTRLVTTLFKIADQLNQPEDEARGFSFASNPLRLQWFLNRVLLPRYPLEERSTLLLAAAKHAAPGWCADLAERCLSPYQPSSAARGEPLVDEANALAIGAIALEGLRAAGQDGRLLAGYGARSMLWALYRLSPEGSTEVRAMTERFLEDDEETIQLARALTSIAWSQGVGLTGMGDRMAMGRPHVDRSGLEKIVDPERMRARVMELQSRSTLSVEALGTLRRFATGWEAGQPE